MSEMFMQNSFPLSARPEANSVRDVVKGSLYAENANPLVSDWSDDAEIFTRASWTSIKERLDDLGIELTPDEEAELINFSSDYASLVDEEEDMAELNAMRNEGETDE